MLRSIFFIVALVTVCIADCYMHMPRGSNNRLNEKSANRNNANRLFDSQNNNRGGYNVGEMHKDQAFQRYGNDDVMYNYENDAPITDTNNNNDNNNNGKRQFEPSYVEASILRTTHTIQHGCGNDKNNCNIVMEYTCDSHDPDTNVLTNAQTSYDYDGLRVQLKNGLNTGTSDAPNSIKNVQATYNTNIGNGRGTTESEEFYQFAKTRERNKGLFTADQKLQGNSQIYTRQNPGGTRRGLEVPEERDYFPWWYPSPWRPFLIWHNNVTECNIQMADKSQAVETKYQCIPDKAAVNNGANNQDALNAAIASTTEQECTDNGGTWKAHKWDMDKPLCIQADWSQVNNLGNVGNTEDGGLPRHFDWQLPTVAQLKAAGCHSQQLDTADATLNAVEKVRLQVRIRYNMTTADYAPYNTDAQCNQDNGQRIQSPIQQNPTVDVGMKMQGLRLAINTAQTGRVFQDRSHVITIMSNKLPNTNAKLHNVNVQGKRGNIVQTFPAVEYDFWPRKLEVKRGECMAFMWTGSNTHNNGNPAGDGQAGDAGEGRGGSDRSNLIQLLDKRESYPIPLDKNNQDLIAMSDCYRTVGGEAMTSGTNGGAIDDKHAQLYLLSGGYYLQGTASIAAQEEMDVLLDNVSATVRSVTCCIKNNADLGDYYFASTRNNNFSNRDQKLHVKVTAA